MTHVARGVNEEGTLTVDVVMRGHVPQLPDNVQVTVLPYTEQYIQTGPGTSNNSTVCLSVCLSLCKAIDLVESVSIIIHSVSLQF